MRDQRSHVAHALLPSSHVVFQPTSKGYHAVILWVSRLECGQWCWVTHCFDCDLCTKRKSYVHIKGKQESMESMWKCLLSTPKNGCFILKTYLFSINNILNDSSMVSLYWKNMAFDSFCNKWIRLRENYDKGIVVHVGKWANDSYKHLLGKLINWSVAPIIHIYKTTTAWR